MADLPNILIVESDAVLGASLKFALELEGFAVQSFQSGEAALAAGAVAGADCAILDQRLCEESGVCLLGRLRSQGLACPAIVTATNPTRAVRREIAAGGAKLVEKPFLCDGLLASIRSAIPPVAAAA